MGERAASAGHVVVWERRPEADGGDARQAKEPEKEATVRTVAVGTTAGGNAPVVIRIVSSGFGEPSASAAGASGIRSAPAPTASLRAAA